MAGAHGPITWCWLPDCNKVQLDGTGKGGAWIQGDPRRNLKVSECIRKRIDGQKVRERPRRQSTRQRRDGGKGAYTIIADTIKG